MVITRVIFEGVRSERLLWTLMLAISAVLLGWGVWQLAKRRWRYAAVCLGSALGPAVGVPLAVAGATAGRAKLPRRTEAILWVGAGGVASALAVTLLRSAAGEDGLALGLWMAIVGAQIALAVALFYVAVYAYLGPPRLAVLMALRLAAIVALLLVLFKPAVSRTVLPGPGDAGKPQLLVFIDRSASMSTRDAAPPAAEGDLPPTRYDYALARLAEQAPALQEHYRLAWRHFARAVTPADSLETLRALAAKGRDTDHTDLTNTLLESRRSAAERETAGVLLITDGIANPAGAEPAAAEVVSAAERTGLPVHAVAVGSLEGPPPPQGKNVRIESVSVDPPVVTQNNVVSVKASVEVSGFARVPVRLRLLEEGPDGFSEVDAQGVWTPKDRETKETTLNWTPRSRDAVPAPPGERTADVRRLRVALAPQAGDGIPADNLAETNVLVTQPRVRVLYVEGSMRPEYKFLKRLLDTDPNIQFMSLVRMGERKFWAYGSLDGRTLAGLPTTDEDFALFDVLVVGDLDRTFWTREQMAGVRRFVNDGGGFVMLGGGNSFGPGDYGGLDIEDVLPVVVGTRAQPQETTRFIPKLTHEGTNHPILEGIGGFFLAPGAAGAEAAPTLPELSGCVTVVRTKPTAETLLVHPTRRNEAGQLVVLAVQQFGVGRSAAFTADTTWRWHMLGQARGAETPYARFWGQLLRWLAGTDTKSRKAGDSVLVTLSPSRTAFVEGQELTLHARVQTTGAAGASDVTCRVEPEGAGEPSVLAMKPQGEATGGTRRYEAEFSAEEAGRFAVRVTAYGKGRRELATGELPLSVLEPTTQDQPPETDPAKLKPDRDLLREVATATKGRYEEAARLNELADYLRAEARQAANGDGPQARTQVYRLYDFTVLFLAFVSLLTVEWLLRRNWQLH